MDLRNSRAHQHNEEKPKHEHHTQAKLGKKNNKLEEHKIIQLKYINIEWFFLLSLFLFRLLIVFVVDYFHRRSE